MESLILVLISSYLSSANKKAILEPSTMFRDEKVSAFIILMICIV